MTKATARLIRERARQRCEYCLLPQSALLLTFPIDHIVARQHSGRDLAENLALACPFCNRHKGPNVAGVDSQTGAIVPLFNPRRQRWGQHFRISGFLIIGKSPIGRATVLALAMNDSAQLHFRAALIVEGCYP